MRKKWLAVGMTLILTLALAACGGETTTEPSMDLSENTNDVYTYFENMPDHIYKISQVDFIEKVRLEEPMTVLDIRNAADYEENHVKGAINLPWGTAISDNLSRIPTDKPVFVYCYTGQTAGQTVMLLNLAGFDARSVNFGWNLGISKVENVEDALTTEVTELSDVVTEIDTEVQQAVTDYYTGLAAVSDTIYKNYKISEDDLKALVDANDTSIYILSVRSAEDYAAGHIENAVNIPFGNEMATSFESTLPKDKTIIVYCYTGQTAGQTTAALRLLGYDAVSLNGGMGTAGNVPSGWSNKGFPVVQ